MERIRATPIFGVKNGANMMKYVRYNKKSKGDKYFYPNSHIFLQKGLVFSTKNAVCVVNLCVKI